MQENEKLMDLSTSMSCLISVVHLDNESEMFKMMDMMDAGFKIIKMMDMVLQGLSGGWYQAVMRSQCVCLCK